MDARISTSLPSHPKTKKLARRLGPAGPLGCIYLFLWVAANRSDGDLSGLTDEDLELAVDWQGDEGAFVAAMSEVGFLDGHESARRVHDWAVHNPWAAGANDRSEASRWAALCKRYGREGAANRMPDYANGMRPARDPDAARTIPQCDPDAPSPIPSPIPSPSPLPKQERVSPAGSRLPDDWSLSKELADWSSTETPNVNLKTEVPKFRDYWIGKPGKEGRKLDWDATWRNWARRAQEYSGGRIGGNGTAPVHIPAGGGRKELT